MSKLDEQLAILMAKKGKITAYNDFKALLEQGNMATPIDKEVFREILAFIENEVALIEDGYQDKQESVVTPKQEVPQVQIVKGVTPDYTKDEIQDKIKFAMANRYLGGKTVKVSVDDHEVSGKITGIDAPYIIVSLPTGGNVSVELEDLFESNPGLRK